VIGVDGALGRGPQEEMDEERDRTTPLLVRFFPPPRSWRLPPPSSSESVTNLNPWASAHEVTSVTSSLEGPEGAAEEDRSLVTAAYILSIYLDLFGFIR
jgi:hypothetical protein